MRRRLTLRLAVLLAILALVAAACGGDKKDDNASSSSSGGETKKELTSAPGFDLAKKEIRLGVITPLTGPVALIGKPLTAGTEVWFQHVNAAGGIAGKYKVVLDEKDSQYIPQNGVQNYNELKSNVVAIAQLLGTPVTKAVLPLLKQDNIVAAPASLDADWVREPNLLPVGAPYQIQMINGAQYALDDLQGKTKKQCSFIQDDAYGQAGQAGLDFAGKELGFKLVTTVKYAATAQDFTAQIQQLKSAGCEIVYLVSTPSITAKAFGTAAQLGFAPKWIGQSPSYIGALSQSPLKDYMSANYLLIADTGTEWGDTSQPGMKQLLDDVQKFKPDQQPDGYFVFGYYQAQATAKLLEKAVELGDLSRAGIKTALEKLGTVTFGGLSGDYKYGPVADREFPRSNAIFKVNPAKPQGLEKVKDTFESDAASKFEL